MTSVFIPNNRFHGAHKLLRSTLPGVDGRRRGLVQMGLRRSPHLAAVVVDMATLAVADRPVAMALAAASWEAGDHGPPDMWAAVLPCTVPSKQEEEEEEEEGDVEEQKLVYFFVLSEQ